jgi:hypothetical protein
MDKNYGYYKLYPTFLSAPPPPVASSGETGACRVHQNAAHHLSAQCAKLHPLLQTNVFDIDEP